VLRRLLHRREFLYAWRRDFINVNSVGVSVIPDVSIRLAALLHSELDLNPDGPHSRSFYTPGGVTSFGTRAT
jgi:hypothetical protein